MMGDFLSPKELSQRWKLSYSTLERWRWLGVGPNYLRIGGRIRYRLEDILAFESLHDEQAIRSLADNAEAEALAGGVAC